MRTYLTYTHGRNLFKDFEFKPFVKKYFKDVKFEGSEFGNWYPRISISNWDEIKDKLPKSYKPIKITKPEYVIDNVENDDHDIIICHLTWSPPESGPGSVGFSSRRYESILISKDQNRFRQIVDKILEPA